MGSVLDLLPVQRWVQRDVPPPAFLRDDFDVALTHAVNHPATLGLICRPRVCAGFTVRTVFAQPGHEAGRRLADLATGRPVNCSTCNAQAVLARDASQRVLVLAGNDRRASTLARFGIHLHELPRVFGKAVLVAALDRTLPGVRAWPQLFTHGHLQRLPQSRLRAMVRTPMADLRRGKSRWLFASWGALYPQLDRSPSCPDRAAARAWLRGVGSAAWVHASEVAPDSYLDVLAAHRFMLSPSGLGVQSPKTYEALLTGTIPICHASNVAYRRLRDDGWPFVVVSNWSDVNSSSMRAWWRYHSRKLDSVRKCMLRPGFAHWAVDRARPVRSCAAP